MNNTPARRLVSMQAAADYLGVDLQLVRRKIAAGELRGYRLGSGPRALVRVDMNEVDEDFLRPIPTTQAKP